MISSFPLLNLLLFFVIGLAVGSFINVCIYRIPNGISILNPRSSCVSCGSPIKWHDIIPVLSYLILRGRCRKCNVKISPRYPLVELVTALCFVILAREFFLSDMLFFYFYYVFVLLSVLFIDYYKQIIPDVFSFSLIFVGLGSSFLNAQLGGTFALRFLNSLGGVLTGGALLFAVGLAGKSIFRQEAMGLGDVKLLAGVGAFAGVEKTVLILIMASVLGSLFGLFLIAVGKIKRRDYIPFGPFISIAAFIGLFISPASFSLAKFFWR